MAGSESVVCESAIGEPPFVVRWGDADDPTPVQTVRRIGRPPSLGPTESAPPWLPTGPEGRPFDFCGYVRRLADSIVRRVPQLAHVQTGHVLFAFTQARNGRRCGLQARVTPLRFAGGQVVRQYRGVTYRVQRWFVAGREIFYLMTFCLPRFLDQNYDDKFVTLMHELYHIGPRFDGDLRRHSGRCALHTSSRRDYDERMAELVRAYLAGGPDPDLHAFLRLNHAQLCQRHGSVVGVRVPRPKIVAVPEY
ncbi:MAG: putative metallopeptidase [Gemmataceae bacterium]